MKLTDPRRKVYAPIATLDASRHKLKREPGDTPDKLREIPASVASYLKHFKEHYGKRKYDTPEELYNAAISHFELVYRHNEPLTFTGTVLSLGFVDPDALDNVSRISPGHEQVVKMIRRTVIDGYERDLRGKYMVGSIFALKNLAGWTDKNEVQVKGLMAGINLDRLDDAQLQRVKSGEHPLAVIAEALPANDPHHPTKLLTSGAASAASVGSTPQSTVTDARNTQHDTPTVPLGVSRATRDASLGVSGVRLSPPAPPVRRSPPARKRKPKHK